MQCKGGYLFLWPGVNQTELSMCHLIDTTKGSDARTKWQQHHKRDKLSVQPLWISGDLQGKKSVWFGFYFLHFIVFDKLFGWLSVVDGGKKKKNWELHNKRNIHEKWSYNHLRHRWWWCDHNKPDHQAEKKIGNRNSILTNSFCCYVYHGVQLFTSYFQQQTQLSEGIFTFI